MVTTSVPVGEATSSNAACVSGAPDVVCMTYIKLRIDELRHELRVVRDADNRAEINSLDELREYLLGQQKS